MSRFVIRVSRRLRTAVRLRAFKRRLRSYVCVTYQTDVRSPLPTVPPYRVGREFLPRSGRRVG